MANVIPTARFVFDRKHIATKSSVKLRKTGLVQIEVLYKRKRKFFSTGVKVYLDQWVDNKENHVVNSVYALEYNDTLKKRMSAILARINELASRDSFSLDDIDGESNGQINIAQLSEMFMDSYDLAKSTKTTYKSFTRTLGNFFGDKMICEFVMADIERFDKSMIKDGKKPVGRRHLLAHMKKIFNFAVSKSFIKSHPFNDYKIPPRKSGERVRLTADEVAQIAQADLPENLVKWRDIFLFQCYTGIAYADLASLTREMIVEENGRWFIDRSRHKTHVHYRVLLLKPALEILKKFDYSIPVGHETACYYDVNLKKIEESLKFKKHLTSHVGRHTFATWALSNGVPIEIVSKMLGHTNIQTTQIYAKILAKDVEQQFLRLDSLFDKK